MENLKEIDLLLMAVPEDIHDNAWVQNAIKMLRDIAEIAKENEPVAWLSRESESGRICLDVEDSGESGTWSPSFPVYELPPTAEQIEQETSEAIALSVQALNDTRYNNECDRSVVWECAIAIRSGKWREYL